MKYTLILAAFTLSIVATSSAQLSERDNRSFSQGTASQASVSQSQAQLQSKPTIQEGPIDPKEYIVGPGDIFGVSIIAASPLNFQIPVTPEGTIIIPTVSSIYISGMRLDSVKELMLKEIKKKYLTVQIYVTLLNCRSFFVTVRGAISGERTILVQATQRVDAAVNYRPPMAIPEAQQSATGQQQPVLAQGEIIVDSLLPQRNITVRHKNGTVRRADIEKYFATGNTVYNPLLEDGDVIIVPNKNITKNFFSVYGAVNRQGEYEYMEGDSLTTALKMARGLTAIADSDKVMITRLSSENKFSYFTVSLKKILTGERSDILLVQGDRIVVYEEYSFHSNAKVYIEGEVKFPGYYPITQDSTHLSEIIQIAGGVTVNALLQNSQLFRRTITQTDIGLERSANSRASIPPEEEWYYQFETNIKLNRELVVSDFYDLVIKHDSTKDVLLRDGDIISIVARKKTVYVFGQVLNPGHISYVIGKDYNYYTRQAGGYTDYAVKGDIKIIKAKSRQWLDPSETTIEEGDYVWVPKDPYRPFSYYVTLYSQVLGIVGTVATLYLLIKSQ